MTPALIGRDHPAGVLRAEIGRATDSHGGLVLVTGEAGIGKTSLVTDAARAARRRGALVLGGSCWASEGAPGFWPWVQVVRGLRRGASAEEWAAAEKATGGRLGVLLGEAPGGAAGAEPGAGAGSRGAGVGGSGSDSGVGSGAGSESGAVVSAVSGSDAFTLYDAVTTALVTVSQSRPVVVVIDDLHWADTASLKLLEFAAQHAWFERLLLICTYRDVEVDAADHPLQQLILPLVARATTVTLTGLERDEVGALMALTAGGREPERSVIDEVYRRTGGNPFYVEETARLWHSGSPVDTVAPGVREAVRRRLALLPEPVGSLLVTAAVLGREFHRKVLAATAGAPVPHVDRLLERAVTARLVVARTEGRFAFAHDLVRDTLYGALAEADVRQRHAQVVRALAASAALSEKVFPADLARHAYLAGAEIELDRALELLLAAARDASGRLATDEAVGHYRRALEVAEADGTVPRRAALIALDLGSELRHAGQMAEGWGYFDRAVVVARELSDAELLARVAITLHRYEELPGQEGVATGLLREAYRALIGDGTGEEGADGIGDGSGSSSGRGGGSGRGDGSGVGSGSGLGADAPGAVEAGLSPDRLAQDLAVRTTALARRGDDDEALAFGLWARHDSIWGLGTSDERLALTAEMATVARRTHDREMEMHASAMRWVTLLEQGDPRYYEQFRTFVAHAQQTALRRFELGVAVDQSLIAALTGHFAEAEELLGSESLTAHESEHAPFGFMAAHLKWGLLLAQGRFDEAAEVLTTLDEVHYPYPGLLEAVTAIERGDDTAALRHLAELSGTPEPYPRFVAPLWLRFQAQTAAASGDEALCERARDALAPYAGQWVVSLYGCDISGPVDLWLGLLAAARGQWDEAADSYTAAYESADRLRARPWAVRARLGLAETLLARGEGDADADAEGDSGSA
ncbi:MAG TPA: AAA family ATPase, partial [Streptomyces sp.]|nr:AAA family ATPase [Streptomyces sp.]